jgi:hypothetical protein
MRAFALCLVLAACQKTPAPIPPAASPAPAPVPAAPAGTADGAGGAWTPAEEACVNRWLQAHGLDDFGSPQGTVYLGGSPLFDEATGRNTTRQAFLAAHHPEALRTCGLP